MSLYHILNQTDLPELAFASISREDQDLAVVVLTARYQLPAPGRWQVGPLALAPEQRPAPLADTWTGEAGQSSPSWDGQAVYVRPGTDIHVHGHAWAPGGRASVAVGVGVRVGSCVARMRAIGDRRWVRSFAQLRASEPEAFERMPLCWERAYGGTTPAGVVEPRNPIGVGVFDDMRAASDSRLPNLVPSDEDCRDWQTPIRPVNFGVVPRHWQPRAGYGGSYDQRWLERRIPLWPPDLDLRLFSAAVPALCATPWLRGAEEVVLEGMHPDGAWGFHLPVRRFLVEVDAHGWSMQLDVVRIDTDMGELAMVWRAAVVLDPRGATQVRVRDALPWDSQVGEARA